MGIGLLLGSCTHETYIDVPVPIEAPANFPPIAYNTAANPTTAAGIALGKKLFYDGRLSSDQSISCAFCHIQANAFTHHGHTVSHGVNNAMGKRNAPAVQNMAFMRTFMWDGAADNLDFQPVIPLLSPLEMNGNFSQILERLKADPSYVMGFKKAFSNGQIDAENLLKALSQFMLTLVSAQSRYDLWKRNEGGSLTDLEIQGYQLFQQKCSSCHATDLFTDQSYRNNGLAINPQVNDLGRYQLTQLDTDRYTFRVPSLRNVEVTAPYMHDGRLGSLTSVLQFYRNNVQNTPNLDPLLQRSDGRGIAMTDSDMTAIIAFLKTLTDPHFLTNPAFAEEVH